MFAESIESNVMGTIYVTNPFLPLIEQGKHRNFTHIITELPDTQVVLKAEIAGMVTFNASKAMINSRLVKYSIEPRERGIQIVAMSPGSFDASLMPEGPVQWMAALFRRVDPDVEGRISPAESVREHLETIETLGCEVQGRIVSRHGNQDRS